MAMTMFDAAKISRNPLTRGVLLGVATTNELISMFPWVPKSGNAWSYDREAALPSIEFVSPTHSSLTESSGTINQVTAEMRIIDSDVDVYNHVQNQNDPNGDPKAIQLGMKLKALGQKIQAKMITGGYTTGFAVSTNATMSAAVTAAVPNAHADSDRRGPGALKYTHAGTFWQYRAPGDVTYGPQVAAASNGTYTLFSDNTSKSVAVTLTVASATANGECLLTFTSSTNEIDGLNKLIPTSQTIASTGASGDALSFDVLDQLLFEKIKVRENLVFLMNSKLKRKYMSLVRSASGGLKADEIALPVLGMNGQMSERRVPAYNGVPILQVDDIPSNEVKTVSTLSSVYCVSLTPEVGFYGGVQSVGGAELSSLDPYTARILGVKLYDVGQLEQKAASRTRVEWFGAMALGSEYAAARASELVTV
jgi:hypothetical protein